MNNPLEFIAILDPAGRTLDSEETIERHNRYAKELKSNSNDSKRLLIVTRSNQQWRVDVPRYLEFDLVQIPVARTNLLGFTYLAFKEIKSKKIIGFVCGDPWESYWISLVIKKLSFRLAKIQVQLHGDFGSSVWSQDSVILKVRQSLICLKSKSIDSLRFTSKNQQFSIQKRFEIFCQNQVIIPVPLNIPNEMIPKHQKEYVEIGFVGRIHFERGLETFLRFAELVQVNLPEACFRIIGNGNQAEWFKTELERRIPFRKLHFTSHLSGIDYFSALANLDVLCSFAPSESYGRTAREAVALGVPVLAVHSAGIDEIAQSLSFKVIHFLPFPLEESTCVESLESALNAEVPSNLIQHFQESNQRAVSRLIQSWMDMVKNDG